MYVSLVQIYKKFINFAEYRLEIMRCRLFHIAGLLMLLALAASCFKDDHFNFNVSGEGTGANVTPSRSQSPDVRDVLVYVAGGFNSLTNYILEDIEDLRNNPLPTRSSPREPVLLVLSRLTADGLQNYTVPNPAVLFRMYADEMGRAVCDTLRIWDENIPLSQPGTIRNALEFVNQAFPGQRYGMIFSSHATGWLPYQYYYEPARFESGSVFAPRPNTLQYPWRRQGEVFPPLNRDDGMPPVKSVGMDDGSPVYEMELEDFAAAIPIHLEYIIFDACLMGGVEVAYELRNVTDLIGFSPTEVMADGFYYKTLTWHLEHDGLNPVGYCQEFFNFYNSLSGSMRSATISVVDTRKLEALAEVCKPLFEKYRTQISRVPGSRVQGYYRNNRHFFYDLKDILVQSGITPEEESLLQNALDQCIVYKDTTPYFLGVTIERYSGLSMYLPSMGTAYLDNFYRNHVAWNRATSLIQ